MDGTATTLSLAPDTIPTETDRFRGTSVVVHNDSKDLLVLIYGIVVNSEARVVPQYHTSAAPAYFTVNDGRTPARLRELAQGVAAIEFYVCWDETKPCRARCSGFAIAQRVILSNFHCAPISIKNARATFDSFGSNVRRKAFELVETIEPAEANSLDFRFFVTRQPMTDRPRIMEIAGTDVAFHSKVGMPLSIIHSPGDREETVVSLGDLCVLRKLPAIGGYAISPALPNDVGLNHGCDTDPGSSGSPVLDRDSGLVLGLHNVGLCPHGPQDRRNCKADPDWGKSNKAVRLSKIVPLIQREAARRPDLFKSLAIRP